MLMMMTFAQEQKGGKMASVNLTVPIKVELPEDWIEQVINTLRNDPDSEWIEVIRCKDCKWFNDCGCAIRIVDDTDKPKENDFCSFAERREDGEE